jgi:hypothetical protein
MCSIPTKSSPHTPKPSPPKHWPQSMAYDEFIASDRSLRSKPKLPAAETAAAGIWCIRNPRAAGRSGCTPAEPYPPSRKIRVDQNVKFYNHAIDKPHTCDLWSSSAFRLLPSAVCLPLQHVMVVRLIKSLTVRSLNAPRLRPFFGGRAQRHSPRCTIGPRASSPAAHRTCQLAAGGDGAAARPAGRWGDGQIAVSARAPLAEERN